MTTEIKNGVARVDFGRPEVANSLDEAAWRELKRTFEDLSLNDNVHVILLTGAGKHFCSGMNVSVLTGLATRIDSTVPDVAGQFSTFIREIQDCINAIESCRQPVIAAVQGACIGGGVAIATACDFIYAAESAYFVVKEVDFGIVPDIGTLQRLPRKIPAGLAAELSLSGRKLSAGEAAVAGLVTQLLPDTPALTAASQEIAERIAAKHPAVTAGIKSQLRFSAENSIADGLREVAEVSGKLMAKQFGGGN